MYVSAISIRLFFGSSTPAMRAIAKPFLALALLVARVGAKDAHDAFAAHDLAVLANLLYRSPDLHLLSLCSRLCRFLFDLVRLLGCALLAHPVSYSAAGQVVRRALNRDLVAGQN